MGTISVEITDDDITDPIEELQKRLARMGLSVQDFETLTMEFDVSPENVVKTGFSFAQAESHLDQGDTGEFKTEPVEADSNGKENTERRVSDEGSMTVDRVGNGDGKVGSVMGDPEEAHKRVYSEVEDTPINNESVEPDVTVSKCESSTDECAENPEKVVEKQLHDPDLEITDRPDFGDIEDELEGPEYVPFDRAMNPEKPYRQILEVLWVANERLTPNEITERTGGPGKSNMKRMWINHYVDRYEHEEGRSWYDYRIAQRGKAVLRQARKNEGKPPLP